MVEPMHGTGLIAPAALALVAALGCGGGDGDTVDASGDYTLAVTNGDNDCGYEGWQEGEQTSGVPFLVSQDDDDQVTATIEGLAGGWVALILGSRTFEGEVSGSRLELTLFGTNSFNEAGCTYTVNGEVLATLNDDALEGTISYRPSTNNSPDCGDLNDCASVQEFNGTRPPQ
jgi:hypothetical protein